MLESIQNDEFEYEKLTQEEQAKRGILGRLKGVIADFKKPTRNGRLYSEELWDKTFENPIMKEKIENRVIFGELGHPADRIETDMEKIAICLAEQPKKGKDGKLYGIFDILDTPNGRILKTLCDYGANIGVSSRGNGDVESDWDGNEAVVPDTYECECWDAVLIPAVKEARLKLVNESLNNKTLTQMLKEELEKATSDDQRIMKETLNNLNLNITPSSSENKAFAANSDGANIVKELQESLLANKKQEEKIAQLQEKLSVCYTKEAKYEESIQKYKLAIQNLSEKASNATKLESKVNSLNESLKEKEDLLQKEKSKIGKLIETKTKSTSNSEMLKEQLNLKDKKIETLTNKINSLNESLSNLKNESSNQIQSLNEELEEMRKNLSIKSSQLNSKVSSSNALVEQYKKVAKTATNKYIESQALRLGISSKDIIRKLPENYSFSDIDKICEDLNRYKININSLPISLQENKKIKYDEADNVIGNIVHNSADDIDDSLLALANLK